MAVDGSLEASGRGRAGGPIRILISSCLLGEKVRYDGGHKRDPFLADTFGKYVEYLPVCPEVGCGLPTPREAMRLIGEPAAPRLVTVGSGIDHTLRMARWTRGKLEELQTLDLWGYICKGDSPSSGMERVKVYRASGLPAKAGAGVFTKAFMDRFPLVPVEEEGRLQDPARREAFIEKLFTLKRFRDLLKTGRTRAGLAAFHADHELLILSHGRGPHAAMGRLVARAKERPLGVVYGTYQRLLMEALSHRATPAARADVLLRMTGHVGKVLDVEEKKELLEVIGEYRRRRIPLVVPVTLLRHHVRKHGVACLERQVFLDPHPAELMLRYHA